VPGHHEGAAAQHLIDVQTNGDAGQFRVAAAGMGHGIWFAVAAFVIFVVMLAIAAKAKKRAARRT
jgi:hypothetical protein